MSTVVRLGERRRCRASVSESRLIGRGGSARVDGGAGLFVLPVPQWC